MIVIPVSYTHLNPIFNHNQLGPYEVTYTVTDVNGCIGSDVLTINLTDNADPTITCPVGDVYKRQLLKWVEDDIVYYHGFIKDVRPLIQQSDCVVLPSYLSLIHI